MGFIKKDEQKKEEAEVIKKDGQITEEAEGEKGRQNGKKRLKKKWIFLLLCLLAAGAAGVYYYFAVYSVTEWGAVAVESVQVAENDLPVETADDPLPDALPETESGRLPEGAPGKEEESLPETMIKEENGLSQEEAPGAPDDRSSEAAQEEPDDRSSEAAQEESDDRLPEELREEESESLPEALMKEESGLLMEDSQEASEDRMSEEVRAKENGRSEIQGFEGTEEERQEKADMSDYTEEEFREICRRVDYKKLLRSQETYLNAAVTEELTVVEQVDGGLFDENIYYLCRREDGQGITRYYIIRDDREEDDMLILAGDVIQVYGQLFGSCKLPGDLVKEQPVVPAVTMVYFDLLDE